MLERDQAKKKSEGPKKEAIVDDEMNLKVEGLVKERDSLQEQLRKKVAIIATLEKAASDRLQILEQ